jgi:hypothetical protein
MKKKEMRGKSHQWQGLKMGVEIETQEWEWKWMRSIKRVLTVDQGVA